MTCVKPRLAAEHSHADKLDIPALEWAGHSSDGDVHRYELIGRYDALIALGFVELPMLAVGRSRKKRGPGYETQALANNRFRLELHLEQALDVATLKPEKQATRVNPLSIRSV